MNTRWSGRSGVMTCVTMALRVAILAATLGVGVAAAQVRTVVRGRVERQASDGRRYVVANVAVTIRDSATARRWRPTYTGRDGLYYLIGVPEGTYYLEVSASRGRAPLRYKISALPQPYTDIPPILIP